MTAYHYGGLGKGLVNHRHFGLLGRTAASQRASLHLGCSANHTSGEHSHKLAALKVQGTVSNEPGGVPAAAVGHVRRRRRRPVLLAHLVHKVHVAVLPWGQAGLELLAPQETVTNPNKQERAC